MWTLMMTDGIDFPNGDIEEERERLAEVDDDELREELERIADEISEWRDEYGVESTDELRESIDEEMELSEREKRREVAYDWEYNNHVRELIIGEAYRRNSDDAAETNKEWSEVSTEANQYLGGDYSFW